MPTRLPPLVSFLLVQCAQGAALGAVFAGVLIAIDAGGLRTLVAATSNPLAPVVLLVVGFASLIGGLYAGVSIMLLPKDE